MLPGFCLCLAVLALSVYRNAIQRVLSDAFNQPGLSKHGEPASPRGIVTRGNGAGLCRARVETAIELNALDAIESADPLDLREEI